MKNEEKKYGLLKAVIICLAVAIILTWLIPTGSFSSTGFVKNETLTRLGLNDLGWLIYNGLSVSIDKIALLLSVGGLYGVLSRINAYDKIVTGIAKKFKNQYIAVVLFSVIIAALTSILNNTFVVIIFIPFIISILNRLKLDKMTIVATTFGSILVGILGVTYGTEGVSYFKQYFTSTNFNKNMTLFIGLGILVVSLALYNFFLVRHMKKVEKENEKLESMDLIEFEGSKESKKRSIVPIIVVGVLLFILMILGFMNWSGNFNLEIFNKFHDAVIEVKIGDDFAIFSNLLGQQLGAFGSWDLFFASVIIFIFTVIIGLCYRVKIDNFFDSFGKGLQKFIKPSLFIITAYMLLLVVYRSTYLATIVNKILSISDGYNLATMSLAALVSNIFHTDLALTGMQFASYLQTEYVDYINPIYTIFTSLYGFVQFFIPTSMILGIGLTSLNVTYKDWLKYIWKFLLGILICLLILFILISVI